ncbi:phosphatase PAP2 family protein [Ekhidna sp.]|uniref:phosphatase PAP2 family protein n=1 Tax=Ekhidna sp. TaxID=2608089 RepID=UPI003CCBEFA0
MINRLRNTRWFFISYLILFGLGMVFYFYQEHGDFVLFLNELHNPVWNFFFKYWTYTGNGFFYAVLSIALIFINRRLGIIMSVSGITIGAVSYFFKFVLFDTAPRPKIYFLDHKILDFVDGVNVLSEHSFPSGHAMAAFGITTLLALMFQHKNYSTILLIGATLTAISRVYLAQHFLIDIMAGSLLGIIIAAAFYMGFEKYLNREEAGPWNTPDEDLAEMDLSDDDERFNHS